MSAASVPTGAAIFVLGSSALPLARQVRDALPGARLHAPAAHGATGDLVYEHAVAHLASLFAAGTPIVGVCAAGILIRAVAPLLRDKQAEPPVVALAPRLLAVVIGARAAIGPVAAVRVEKSAMWTLEMNFTLLMATRLVELK